MDIRQLVGIFCQLDDFCKELAHYSEHYLLTSPSKGKRDPADGLAVSELMTILMMFQMSKFRDLKNFYTGFLTNSIPSPQPSLAKKSSFCSNSLRGRGLPIGLKFLLTIQAQQEYLEPFGEVLQHRLEALPLKGYHSKLILRNRRCEQVLRACGLTTPWKGTPSTLNKKQFKFILLISLPVEEMKLRAKQLDPALFKKKNLNQ